MSISLVTINGHSPYLKYEDLDRDVHQLFSTVNEAKIFVYNNFPVSLANGVDFDLLIIIGIPDKIGNYYRLKYDERGKSVYLHNQIIPVKIITDYGDDEILVRKNELYTESDVLDFEELLASNKFGLKDYLVKRCAFVGDKLFINPVVFIQNNKKEVYDVDGLIIGGQFTFPLLLKHFQYNRQQIFQGYRLWKSAENFETIVSDVGRITEQAALDSINGFLTKKKLDHALKESLKESKAISHLGKSLVILNGKAGSGKSSQLLSIAFYGLRNGLSIKYLTYNRLLVYDIAKLVKSYSVSLTAQQLEVKNASVSTLHSFIYQFAKALKVLNVISEPRINEILSGLKEKMAVTYNFLKPLIATYGIDISILKSEALNSGLNVDTKDFALKYVEYIEKEKIVDPSMFRPASAKYFKKIRNKLLSVSANEVFIVDYYKVLHHILEQISDPASYYNKHDLGNKLEVLESTGQISDMYKNLEDDYRSMSESGFVKFTRRRINARARKKILLVDEAQDCHRLEKDILIELFGAANIVVADGGKEQLIRHLNLCNWTASQGKRYPVAHMTKKMKSYRMKRSIVDLCNFIANHFDLALELEAADSVDVGEVILDFRSKNTGTTEDTFTQLRDRGMSYGCTPYESLLIILNSSSQRTGASTTEGEERVEINEYDNVRIFEERKRGDWAVTKELEDKGFMFWNGTSNSKSKLLVPAPNEIRYIYYESCRGLEAWCVACYDFDVFFDVKQNEEDAERFMMDDLLLNAEVEKRKKMFAANWVLMALTRAIDTLYIHLHNPNSELGLLLTEYAKFNKNVKVLKN